MLKHPNHRHKSDRAHLYEAAHAAGVAIGWVAKGSLCLPCDNNESLNALGCREQFANFRAMFSKGTTGGFQLGGQAVGSMEAWVLKHPYMQLLSSFPHSALRAPSHPDFWGDTSFYFTLTVSCSSHTTPAFHSGPIYVLRNFVSPVLTGLSSVLFDVFQNEAFDDRLCARGNLSGFSRLYVDLDLPSHRRCTDVPSY